MAADQWFIADAPIAQQERDAFGHHDVAQNLLTMIRGRTHGRLLIGLLGPFGVGKSTVIELLKSNLEHDRDHALVRISAERHENVGRHRSLIYAAAEKLVEEGCLDEGAAQDVLSELEYSRASATADPMDTPLFVWAREITRSSRRYLKKLGTWTLCAVAAAAALLGTLALLGVDITQAILTWTVLLTGIVSLLAPTLGTLWNVSSGNSWLASWLRPAQNTITRPRVEAADEFERAFAQLISSVKKKVVIAVDDIDRLAADQVLDTLNAIRSFQLTCPANRRPVFIVSADEAVIREAVVHANPGLAASPAGGRETAKAYLDRLFVQRQLMPPHSRRDLRSYAGSILAPGQHAGAAALGDELDNTLAVLIHDEVTDPRHVIRLLNAYFGDYRLARQREEHQRIRSITPGEVTSHPRTLAQMTVLKVDFPEFFELLRGDTSLIDLVADTARTGETEAELSPRGLDTAAPWFRSLLRYIGRTSGFVPPVDDLLPFIYLGQDEIDRLVGSRDAREAHTLLVNTQIADLRNLISRVSASGDTTRTDGLVRLIIDTLETAVDIELANTLGSVTHVISELPASSRTDLSNAFAVALATRSSSAPDLEGLTTLATHASEPHYAQTIGAYLFSGDIGDGRAMDRSRTVLDHREELTNLLGANTVTEFLEGQIADIGTSYADIEEWFDALASAPASDLHPALSLATLRIIDGTEEDCTREWADKALTVFDPNGPSDREEATRLVKKIVRENLATDVGRLAVKGFEAWESTEPKELADITCALFRGALTDSGTLESSITADTRMSALQLVHAAVRHAPRYWVEIDGTRIFIPVMAARYAAAVLKHQRGEDPRAPLIALLADLVNIDTNTEAGSILAAEFIAAWNEDGPIENASAETTLGVVAPYLDKLDEATAHTLRDALLASAEPAASDVAFAGYTTVLPTVFHTNTGKDWIPTLLSSQRGRIGPSDESTTERAVNATQVVFSNTEVAASDATPILDALKALFSYGQSQGTAANAIASLYWPPAVQHNALQALEQHANLVSEAAYTRLAHRLIATVPQQPIPSAVSAGLRIAVTKIAADGAHPDTLAPLIGALSFDEAVRASIAIANTETGATTAIYREPDIQVALKQFTSLLIREEDPAAELSNVRHLVTLASHVAEKFPNEYEAVVGTLIDSQLAGDTHAAPTTWAVLLNPLKGEAAEKLYAGLANAVTSSVGDVNNARDLVAAGVQCETHRNSVTTLTITALKSWIREQPSPQNCTSLATALFVDEHTRVTALRAIENPKPRNREQRQAWEAAVRELR